MTSLLLLNARLAQANLITGADFDVKLLSLNGKITLNKSKHLFVETELKKLKTFDSSYFRGKSHFEEDGTQNYLVFQPMYRYLRVITSTNQIGNLNDYLMKLIKFLQNLIIFLNFYWIIMA